MQVEPKDGTCRSCEGTLKIIDADDATMTVECIECGDTYLVEPDAFGDCRNRLLESVPGRDDPFFSPSLGTIPGTVQISVSKHKKPDSHK